MLYLFRRNIFILLYFLGKILKKKTITQLVFFIFGKEVPGIYLFENIENKKRYVGQGKNVHKRMFQDHREVRLLRRAIKKYGIKNFEISILEVCKIEELNKNEIFWISFLNSHVSKNGYNISFGGNSPMKNLPVPQDVRDKISKSQSGDKNHNYGKSLSENHKSAIRKARTGTTLSDETKKKISDKLVGENNPFYGKKHSEESIKIMTEARSGTKSYCFGTKKANASSRFHGLHKRTRTINGREYVSFIVNISYNGKTLHAGERSSEIEAAKLYNDYVLKNNLPHPLNDIPE
jgi:group I intron endonuclease